MVKQHLKNMLSPSDGGRLMADLKHVTTVKATLRALRKWARSKRSQGCTRRARSLLARALRRARSQGAVARQRPFLSTDLTRLFDSTQTPRVPRRPPMAGHPPPRILLPGGALDSLKIARLFYSIFCDWEPYLRHRSHPSLCSEGRQTICSRWTEPRCSGR